MAAANIRTGMPATLAGTPNFRQTTTNLRQKTTTEPEQNTSTNCEACKKYSSRPEDCAKACGGASSKSTELSTQAWNTRQEVPNIAKLVAEQYKSNKR